MPRAVRPVSGDDRFQDSYAGAGVDLARKRTSSIDRAQSARAPLGRSPILPSCDIPSPSVRGSRARNEFVAHWYRR
jgi:hypothetical protein